ncbi:MAG: NUDIX domain-containing protein [Candidatus Nanohaloarchaea archaeon]|nr:NUDIX domain-containing protein [Candidatus Nanohaloarchaea archaeon]
MEKVEGVVVVLYREGSEDPRFAVLRREKNWEGWELVKGGIDQGESAEEAAAREVEEETGIEPVEVEDMEEVHEWDYRREGENYHAEYQAFLAKAPEESYIEVDSNHAEEHSKGFFLNLRDTKGLLTHENQRALVEKAAKIIQERG